MGSDKFTPMDGPPKWQIFDCYFDKLLALILEFPGTQNYQSSRRSTRLVAGCDPSIGTKVHGGVPDLLQGLMFLLLRLLLLLFLLLLLLLLLLILCYYGNSGWLLFAFSSYVSCV